MHIVDTKLKENLGAYLVQSGLATLLLIVVFSIGDMVARAAIFAAVGSTTFVIFAMPRSPTAAPRRVIGGHLVGLAVGGACALFLETSVGMSLQEAVPYTFNLVAAFAVGLAIFTMAATNTEHAPAGGTTLGMVIVGWDVYIIVFVMVAAAILSLFHQVMGDRLRDLV